MLSLAALSLLSALTTAPNPQVGQPALSQTPAVAKILPADTPLVGLVNVNPTTWSTLRRFQLFEFADVGIKSLTVGLPLDYGRDVQSWLGDQVALALMPQVGKADATIDSNFLIVAPVKNQSRLQQLLAQVQPNKQQRMLTQQYKGITITELQQLPAKPIPSCRHTPNSVTPKSETVFATLPGYLLIASTVKPIEQLIDLPKSSPTLKQNSAFQRTIGRRQVGQELLIMYENPAKFYPLLQSLVKTASLPLPEHLIDIAPEGISEFSSVDGFLLVQPEGIHLQVNGYRQTPRTSGVNIFTTQGNQLLARLPGSTYTVSSGHNLNYLWQILALGASVEPQLKPQLTQFRNFVRSHIGLDFDRDVMAWMDGDYALFSYPTKGGLAKLISPKLNLGFGFLVQTSNRTAATASMQKLDRFIESYSHGNVDVASQLLQDQPVTSWGVKRANSANSVLAYTWINGNTLLVTTGLGAMTGLVPPPHDPLTSSYNFVTATSSLPQPNNGYFYLNMGSFLSWAYGFVPPQANDPSFLLFQRLVGTIYSISATSTSTPEQEEFDGLMVLAPTRNIDR